MNSCHINTKIQFEVFHDQINSVANILRSNTREMEIAYRVWLTTLLDLTRFLLKYELSFRGQCESDSSLNRDNFPELLLWFHQCNDDVSGIWGTNAHSNNQMNSL